MTKPNRILLLGLMVGLLAIPMVNVVELEAREVHLVLNPYENVDWDAAEPHKASFHSHTIASDGRDSPHKMVDHHHQAGFSILALTDHDLATYPWTAFEDMEPSAYARRRFEDGIVESLAFQNRDPDALGMIAVAGSEVSREHDFLSLFSDFEPQGHELDTVLEEMAAYSEDGLAAMAHPSDHWLRKFGPKPGFQVPLAPPLRQITAGDFTLEAWVRPTDKSRSVVMGNYATGKAGVLNLKLQTWINEVRLYMQPGGEGARFDAFHSANDFDIDIRDREWHHLATVRRAGAIYVYLDGKELGQSPDLSGSFHLQGDFFYIGRDTRSGAPRFNGDLDNVRIWGRGLSAEEVGALAFGKGAGEEVGRDDLLVEYLFETSGGIPVQQGPGRQVDDTANHPNGPFHAHDKGDGFYTEDIAKPMRSSRSSSHAMSFTFPFPTEVPAEAIDYYVDLYKRHGHLVAIEVDNATQSLQKYDLDRQLWDRLLHEFMPERPVWGLATSDAHSIGRLGQWAVFPADSLSVKSVRQAMVRGAFYFSSVRIHDDKSAVDRTPIIESITHDADRGVIGIAATVLGAPLGKEAYVWISAGKIVHSGPTLNYRVVDGIGNYVRVEITGSGGITYTNPFGFRTLSPPG